jgi:predicted AlkP superfamily pyrophosphatase or phosphodiesterase
MQMARRIFPLLLVLALCPAAPIRAQLSRSRLIVLLVVDQMRADYIDNFSSQWTAGLRRLLAEGASFRQVEYPYFDTLTCPGHSTIATGTLPATHRMVLNVWWDPRKAAEVRCTQDDTTRFVSYGRTVRGSADSAANLQVATLGDQLRALSSPRGRVISFSLKARAAIPLGGRHPDAVTWFDDVGTWVTSSAFTRAPVPPISDFIRGHPVEADFDEVWDRAAPKDTYRYDATAVGAVPGAHTASFPHALRGDSASPDPAFYERWQTSPLSDRYLARMALDVAKQMHFDTAGGTNMIAIGFSALDRVGHAFGPQSHEVQDTLLRLDVTLGALFAGLDELIGAHNYTVALVSDHGVAPIPEQASSQALDAGRMTPAQLADEADEAFRRVLGPGHYVAHVVSTHVYLNPGVLDMVNRRHALDAIRQGVRALPFVADVYSQDQISPGDADRAGTAAAIARSNDPSRSGDLTIVLRPNWIAYAGATTHGTAYAYDTRVPLMLMGEGIRPGQYLEPASPLDVAPTLAFLAGVRLPQAEGRVLHEALFVTSSRPSVPETVTSVR